ncbi:MAG: aldo/keto reductase [Rhodospirillales bacterium]|nr:aldo/keto reductase [Rhodospirillales bacterium]
MAIEKRAFGRTGHMSTEVVFGSAALWSADQAEADKTLDLLFEYGINHIDTAADYANAETLIGPWMKKHRKEFFLATKTSQRDYAGAKESLHKSLDLLNTDHVDLFQIHALIHPDQWDQAFAPGGVLEAMIKAREEGLVKHIGVTGHGWNVAAMHRRSLEQFDFDAVLMPWNWHCAQHTTYADDFKATAAICEERNVAVQTIKSLARGPWPSKMARRRTPWYEPLEGEDDIRTAISWVLGHPDLFLLTTADLGLLPTILRVAAERGDKPDDAAMKAFEEKAGLATIFGI